MKNSITIITVAFFASCGSKTESFEPARPAHISSYELVGKDTINLTDAKGLKQGIWITYTWTAENKEHAERVPIDTNYYKDGVEVKN